VEVKEEDLDQIRAFPRAQWRKIAQGNFSMTGIAECMRAGQNALDRRFLAKIAEIQDRLKEDTDLGSVVLIGMNESGPLTVLDGNHRLVAAMLASPSGVHRLRFLCGLSPRMTECCWYNTNFATLFRYGRNVLWHVVRKPNAGLGRLFAKSWIAETRE
jgi:hypothetical protein